MSRGSRGSQNGRGEFTIPKPRKQKTNRTERKSWMVRWEENTAKKPQAKKGLKLRKWSTEKIQKSKKKKKKRHKKKKPQKKPQGGKPNKKTPILVTGEPQRKITTRGFHH